MRLGSSPIFLLIFLLGCFIPLGISQQTSTLVSENINKQLTKIHGTIDATLIPSIRIKFFRDYVSFDEEQFTLPLDNTGNFGMNFELEEPTVAILFYLGQAHKIYLEPGDDLKIEFGGPDYLNGDLVFSGKGSAHNNYFRDYLLKFEYHNSTQKHLLQLVAMKMQQH